MANLQLTQAAVNELRDKHWAYNNYTGLYEKVTLLEKAGANGFTTYSTDLSNAAWTKTGLNVPTMTVTGPDGVVNSACTMIEDTSTGTHNVSRGAGIIITAGATQSVTRWIKIASGARYVRLSMFSGSDSFGVVYNPTTRTITPANSGVGTLAISKVTFAANGWVKLHIAGIVNGTSTLASVVLSLSSDGVSFSYTGDGVSGFYVYNAQAEIDQPIWSSDMPSVGAVAGVRSADIDYIDLAVKCPTMAVPREGTWYVKFIELGTILLNSSGVTRIFQIGDNATASTNSIYVVSTVGSGYGTAWVNGSTSVGAAYAGTIPALNDLVELLIHITADGHVEITQATNGVAGSTVVSTGTEAYTAAFANTKVYLGSKLGTIGNGLLGLKAFACQPGNQSLATMRALAAAA